MTEDSALSVDEWSRLVAKAWLHPEFAEQLQKDPTAAIKRFATDECGKPNLVYCIVIPPKPPDMSEQELDEYAHKIVVSLDQLTCNPTV